METITIEITKEQALFVLSFAGTERRSQANVHRFID
jgi:hypothetical protein